MTTSKYFGIDGLSANVQFGKSGPRVVGSANGFSLVLADGSAAPLTIGDATLAGHAVTKAGLDAATLTLSTATSDLSATIGLDANGNFVIPNTAKILTSGMTITAGLIALDTAVSAETSRAEAAEGALSTRATALETGAQQTNTLVGTALGSIGLDAQGRLTAFTGTTYLGSASTLRTALIDLDSAAAALDAKYATKTSDLSTQIGNNTSAIAALNQQITGTSDAHVLLDDGSHPLAANLSAAGFRITDVGTPINLGDVATKGYTDTLFSQILNPFQYIGAVTGGVDASTATDLSTLAKTVTGDYYKVTAAGYFKYGNSTPVYANIGDGIIFNTTSGFDIIGGTATKVFGTNAAIVVTGSADTGYTVDLDSSVKTRLSNVEGLASTNVSAISAANTVINRVIVSSGLKADGSFSPFSGTHYLDGTTTLAGGLRALDTAVNGAQTAASTATSNLSAIASAVGLGAGYVYTPAGNAVITASATTVAGAISALDNALAQTNTGVGTLSSNLTGLTSRVTSGFTGAGLSTAGAYTAVTGAPILASATSLANADSLLEARIVSDRTAADSGFSAAQAALSAAEASLQDKITAVTTGAGLNADGSYAAASGRYIAAATSLANADLRLDAALASLRDDFTDRAQDRILSSDSLAQVVVASSTTPLTISAPVNAASVGIASFTTSGTTDSNLVFDLSQAGYVTLRAASVLATASTLRVASQGGAPVEIGDEDADSMIQPQPGRALTLAGGDSGDATGGNLLLRGGTGPTTSGMIIFCDAASNPLLTISTGAAGVRLDLSASASASTLSAQGSASDIDVVIEAKGAGTVSVAGARISSVADANGPQDAVNLQTLSANIAQALTPTIQAMVASVSETTGAVAIGARSGARVVEVRITVLSPFDAGTAITIGDNENSSYVLNLGDLDLTQVVTYALDVEAAVNGSNPIQCYVETAANPVSSQGALEVILFTTAG